MITQLTSAQEMQAMPLSTHHARKAHSLYQAYGLDSGLCRFYRIGEADTMAIAVEIDGALILAPLYHADEDQLEELAAYISMTNPHAVELPEALGQALGSRLDERYTATYPNAMHFHGKAPQVQVKLKDNPRLDDVFAILQCGFEGLRFDTWYVDLSHRIRRDLSRAYMLDDAATCTMQYDVGGWVFLSQIATRPEMRGKGYASSLVRQVASNYILQGREVMLYCRDALVPFYEGIGFVRSGAGCTLTRK